MRQTALFGLPEHIVPYSLIAFGYPVDKNRHLLPKLPHRISAKDFIQEQLKSHSKLRFLSFTQVVGGKWNQAVGLNRGR
jgi:hypothetical protein